MSLNSWITEPYGTWKTWSQKKKAEEEEAEIRKFNVRDEKQGRKANVLS